MIATDQDDEEEESVACSSLEIIEEEERNTDEMDYLVEEELKLIHQDYLSARVQDQSLYLVLEASKFAVVVEIVGVADVVGSHLPGVEELGRLQLVRVYVDQMHGSLCQQIVDPDVFE